MQSISGSSPVTLSYFMQSIAEKNQKYKNKEQKGGVASAAIVFAMVCITAVSIHHSHDILLSTGRSVAPAFHNRGHYHFILFFSFGAGQLQLSQESDMI